MKKKFDISEKNPFKVPENYFDEVNRKIISATSGKTEKAKKISLFTAFRPLLAIAASVAILALLTYTGIKTFQSGNRLAGVSDRAVEEFSEMIINEIDMQSLEESLVRLEAPVSSQDSDKDEIIEYLLLENIDLNDIYELL
ncbi:MAG: hypothetical protein GYA41_02970 [Bacteroidales bacterium]|nr:hypothetical protein [Bacteroidales bacterium]